MGYPQESWPRRFGSRYAPLDQLGQTDGQLGQTDGQLGQTDGQLGLDTVYTPGKTVPIGQEQPSIHTPAQPTQPTGDQTGATPIGPGIPLEQPVEVIGITPEQQRVLAD